MPIAQFSKRFLLYILLTWMLPPFVGLSFLVFIDMFSWAELVNIASRSGLGLFALATLVFALWYFNRFSAPWRAYIGEQSANNRLAAIASLQRFPYHYWSIFLLTIVVRPAIILFGAEHFIGYTATPLDWVRLHLMVVIVSILIGVPIFLRIIDLLGCVLGPAELPRPVLTVKTRVFLIGALIPLLIDTVLVQYFWARTGYFTSETVIMWLALELLAIAASLFFVRSFDQSLSPLRGLLQSSGSPNKLALSRLEARSTDELGTLATEYRRMLAQHLAVEEQLRRSEGDLQKILDNLQDTYYRTNLAGEFVYLTPQVEHVLGYRPEELLGRRVADIYVNPQTREELLHALKESGTIQHFINPLYHKDGHIVWGSANLHFYRDESGGIAGVEGVVRDITPLKLAEEALQKEQQRAQVTLESIGDGVITTNTAGNIDYLNPVAERLLDCRLNDVRGRHYEEALSLIDESSGERLKDLITLVLQHDGTAVHADDGMLRHTDGTLFNINVTAAPMRDSGNAIVGAVLVLHDITEVMSMAQQLSYQASHDVLTGLINRREFEKRLGRAIRSARNEARHHVLFYMDLDQFKVVNDTCGHLAGDELLMQLAEALRGHIRDNDTLARLGGDEFGMLLEDCPLDEARAIADELRQKVKDFRFNWENRSFEVGVCIGVVPIHPASGTLTDILSTADAACYVAKDAGRNRVHVYHAEDTAVARHHGEMAWIHRITDAFESHRFTLHWQRIEPLSVTAKALPHGEVLMRMLDEEGAVIPPTAFIPAAERYNLMPTIDRWVVRSTLGMMREAQGPAMTPPFTCAINLSGQSLTDEHFLDFVMEQLHEYDITGDHVCFEITETAAITNLSRARKFIDVLERQGCLFSLDDFGSGLSSFGYLKGLKVDYVKIDGGFVKDMMRDPLDHAMVNSINEIGHVMGLKTVAEFVENEAILTALREIGIDYAQGYAIAAPEPFEAVVRRLGKGRAKT